MTTQDINWQALAEPFKPEDVSFRLQGNPRDGSEQAIVVAYLDSRNVQQRLDEVCGPDGWSFDWQPIVTNASAVLVAKGTLTIAGVSKSDVGDAGQTEPSKASVSDALKRTAVLFGIGRYLYDLPVMWARVEKNKHGGYVLARGEEDNLRAKYLKGKPGNQNAPVRASQPQQHAPTPEASAQHSQRPLSAVIRETDAQPLNRNGQMDLVRMLREAGHNTPNKTRAFLAGALPDGRVVDVDKLLVGESDLTVGEMGLVLSTLNGAQNGKAAAR